jgi:hypothetical protein
MTVLGEMVQVVVRMLDAENKTFSAAGQDSLRWQVKTVSFQQTRKPNT